MPGSLLRAAQPQLGNAEEGQGAGLSRPAADFAAKPPRQAGQVVKDEGDGGVKLSAFLAEQKFI